MTCFPHVCMSPTHRPFHSLKIYLRSIKAISQKLSHEASGHHTKHLLESIEMDAQLQRTAIAACSGSANFGEVMATARRMNLADCDCCYLGMRDYFREDDAFRGAHRLSAAKPSSTCRPCEVNRVRVHLFVGLRPF
jgi:hypothetical protein